MITKLTPTLFADDNVLYISGSISTELQNIVKEELYVKLINGSAFTSRS